MPLDVTGGSPVDKNISNGASNINDDKEDNISFRVAHNASRNIAKKSGIFIL